MDLSTGRLAAIAGAVSTGKSIADIGADHAQLPIYLVAADIIPWAIAVELGDGPLRRAQMAVGASCTADRIEVRQGSGLQVLAAGEVGTVVLAGLGGDTIVEILSADWNKAGSFPRFIFQPMSKPEVLRTALAAHGWNIEAETLVEERGRLFLIITSCPGNSPYFLNDLETWVGPFVSRADDEVKLKYIEKLLHTWRKVELQLRRSSEPEHGVQAQILNDRIRNLEGIWNAGQGK